MGAKRQFKPVYRLEDWHVQFADNPGPSPRLRAIRLCGAMYGHELFDDGHRVTTTTIESIVDLVAKTRTGSVYSLGEPDRVLVAYLEGEYPGWDWRNPMTFPGAN